jgi:hypothetical protein
MKITITIPDAAIRSAILGAHSRYWASGLTVHDSGSYSVVERYESHSGPVKVTHRFGSVKIRRAIVLLSQDQPNFESFGRLCDGCCDGPDGDLLIQYACFGELKYG